MDEFISRKAAIAYIREQSEECQKAFEEFGGESGIYADAYNDLAEDFYSIPAADVAPVVRCKDCTHYDMGVCLKIYSDGNVHPEAWQSRRPDDFCSYGERKDGGDSDAKSM